MSNENQVLKCNQCEPGEACCPDCGSIYAISCGCCSILPIVDSKDYKSDDPNEARLKYFCRQVWWFLTDDEKDAYYCDIGIIGFIEHCAQMLHIRLDDFKTRIDEHSFEVTIVIEDILEDLLKEGLYSENE